MSAHPVPSPRLCWLAAGFGVWCSALVFLYALHATGCAYGWSAGTLRLVLVAVVLAHLVAIGWMWHTLAGVGPDPGSGETGAFLHAAFLWTVIASFVATAPYSRPAASARYVHVIREWVGVHPRRLIAVRDADPDV